MNGKQNSGFTIIELIVTIGIVVMILGAIWIFILRGYQFQELELNQIANQEQARAGIEEISSELREAAQSDNGAYPIESADSYSIIFYSDIDDDGSREKIHYWLDGQFFKKTVTEPTAFPVSYPAENESEEKIITRDVINGTTPIYEYFDRNYQGTEEPMSLPVNISNIRLIKITLIVDNNTDKEPPPFTLSSDIQLRNLKDNL